MFLQTHTYRDYTYAVVSAHTTQTYELHDLSITYFAFPRLGLAVPLRQGDVLFFNPKEPHCASSRYKDDDTAHTVSLYLKSANIGLHDNSLPLTSSDKILLRSFENTFR